MNGFTCGGAVQTIIKKRTHLASVYSFRTNNLQYIQIKSLKLVLLEVRRMSSTLTSTLNTLLNVLPVGVAMMTSYSWAPDLNKTFSGSAVRFSFGKVS